MFNDTYLAQIADERRRELLNDADRFRFIAAARDAMRRARRGRRADDDSTVSHIGRRKVAPADHSRAA